MGRTERREAFGHRDASGPRTQDSVGNIAAKDEIQMTAARAVVPMREGFSRADFWGDFREENGGFRMNVDEMHAMHLYEAIFYRIVAPVPYT